MNFSSKLAIYIKQSENIWEKITTNVLLFVFDDYVNIAK